MSSRRKRLRRKRRQNKVVVKNEPKLIFNFERDRNVERILGVCCLITLFLFIREFEKIADTIGGVTLALLSVFVGMTIGLGVIYGLRTSIAKFLIDGRFASALFLTNCLFLSPTVGSVVNRCFSHSAYQEQCLVVGKTETYTRRSGHHHYLSVVPKNPQRRAQGIRLHVGRSFWATVAEGETVQLGLHIGFFGFPTIEKVEKQYVSPA